jgi:hypothetical protein
MRADMNADGRKVHERRSSERISDDSVLLVNGYDTSGLPFSEITKINDVSPGGISFPLRTPIEIDAWLDVTICSSQSVESGLLPMFQVKAHVLRVSKIKESDEFSMIAAQFHGDFAKIAPDYDIEDIAKELEVAIELDERVRKQ